MIVQQVSALTCQQDLQKLWCVNILATLLVIGALHVLWPMVNNDDDDEEEEDEDEDKMDDDDDDNNDEDHARIQEMTDFYLV